MAIGIKVTVAADKREYASEYAPRLDQPGGDRR